MTRPPTVTHARKLRWRPIEIHWQRRCWATFRSAASLRLCRGCHWSAAWTACGAPAAAPSAKNGARSRQTTSTPGRWASQAGSRAGGDLADQNVVANQTQLRRRTAVADGVRHQFADDQFGGEEELVQPPPDDLAGSPFPSPADGGRIGRDPPAGGVLRRDDAGAGQQQGRVVARRLVRQVGEDSPAGCVRRAIRTAGRGQRIRQPSDPLVDVVPAPFDHAVGAEREDAARLQVDRRGLVRHAANGQWRPRADLDGLGGSVGPDQDGWWMSGTGHGAALHDRQLGPPSGPKRRSPAAGIKRTGGERASQPDVAPLPDSSPRPACSRFRTLRRSGVPPGRARRLPLPAPPDA